MAIKSSDDGEDILREYLRDAPTVMESGIDRASELMERFHVSKRGAIIMIDHDQDEF